MIRNAIHQAGKCEGGVRCYGKEEKEKEERRRRGPLSKSAERSQSHYVGDYLGDVSIDELSYGDFPQTLASEGGRF